MPSRTTPSTATGGSAETAAESETVKVDPRFVRSRAQLHAAVLALAAERALAEISISDITDWAGVNRATFYQHYREKDGLLADAMNSALTQELGLLRAGRAAHGSGDTPESQLISYFRHIDRHRAVYRRALGPQGSALVITQVRENLEESVIRGMRPPIEDDVPVWLRAAFLAGALMGMVTAWVRSDNEYSPEAIGDAARQLLTEDRSRLSRAGTDPPGE
ncbi:TetR/AcrR family transcriptional regulator [Pengzhenrongella sp.]|jgi:AcrR family transcriptional regulator|uniref:TetR/AcrR family transcriptional regulator n=1 Tax=Pengzhenrongella sp. TaxID=2888820 RepID=UPI002F93AC89